MPAPVGTPVFAAADGEVVYAGTAIRGYGNMVVLKHAGDLLTVYAHNSAPAGAHRGPCGRPGKRSPWSGRPGTPPGRTCTSRFAAGKFHMTRWTSCRLLK